MMVVYDKKVRKWESNLWTGSERRVPARGPLFFSIRLQIFDLTLVYLQIFI